MPRKLSFYALLGIVVACGILFYRVMVEFFVPLFLAVVLVVIFRPLHQWLLKKTGGRNYLAAGGATLAIVLMVIVPIGSIFSFAAVEGVALTTSLDFAELSGRLRSVRERLDLELPQADAVHAVEETLAHWSAISEQGASLEARMGVMRTLRKRVERLRQELDSRQEKAIEQLDAILEMLPSESQPVDSQAVDHYSLLEDVSLRFDAFRIELSGGALRAFFQRIANPGAEQVRQGQHQVLSMVEGSLPSVTGKTTAIIFEFLLGTIIMVVALFYFFADGPAMLENLMRLSPLEDHYEQELLIEFDRISRAVVLATLLSAVVQAVLAGIGFYFAGVESVFLLTALTMVFSMIPFVGAAAVWLPVSCWLMFVDDRWLAGGLLFVYGAGIVSLSDNVIKPLVLHGQSKLHPLAALLSVLGGVQALGPIGILVGPMVVAFLQVLLKILHRDISADEAQRNGEVAEAPSSTTTGTPAATPPPEEPPEGSPPES